MKTFLVLQDGTEIARITGELEFAKIGKKKPNSLESEMVDDPYLFKIVDVDKKPLIVIALSHYKNLTVQELADMCER